LLKALVAFKEMNFSAISRENLSSIENHFKNQFWILWNAFIQRFYGYFNLVKADRL